MKCKCLDVKEDKFIDNLEVDNHFNVINNLIIK